jgi:hypothetical protein
MLSSAINLSINSDPRYNNHVSPQSCTSYTPLHIHRPYNHTSGMQYHFSPRFATIVTTIERCRIAPSPTHAMEVFEAVLRDPALLANDTFFATSMRKNDQIIRELSANYPLSMKQEWLGRRFQERMIAARSRNTTPHL